jgi:hypothetical protein
MSEEIALKITKVVSDSRAWYSLTFEPGDVAPLAKAFATCGRDLDGYTAEAILVRLSEIGGPAWADELELDTESSCCVVRCARKAPLVHLLRRLEKRLAEPAKLQRLIRSLPDP